MGGAQYLLPTLKARMLAPSLLENLRPDEDTQAEREVIALWESAESKALVAAVEPFNRNMGEARFEIGA